MFEICKYMLFSILVSSVLELSNSYELQRISESIARLEMKVIAEGMYTRKDIYELQEAMDRIEGRLNLTYADTEEIKNQNQSAVIDSLERAVAELTDFKVNTEWNLKNLSESLENVREGLENDIALNERSRRHVSDIDAIINTLTGESKRISGNVHAILKGIERLYETVKTVQHNTSTESTDGRPNEGSYPESCLDAFQKNQTWSGVYTVQPANSSYPVQVYCDQETDGGGWTVFQRRQDGSEDFNRTWQEYKDGFGDLEGEFWLGNENIHQLLSVKRSHELRVELMRLRNSTNSTRFAKYSTFMVGPETSNYTLTVDGYTGNAGDALGHNNGHMFSTEDKDDGNGRSCSRYYSGGWWLRSSGGWFLCHRYAAYLNGNYNNGIRWNSWEAYQFAEMGFR